MIKGVHQPVMTAISLYHTENNQNVCGWKQKAYEYTFHKICWVIATIYVNKVAPCTLSETCMNAPSWTKKTFWLCSRTELTLAIISWWTESTWLNLPQIPRHILVKFHQGFQRNRAKFLKIYTWKIQKLVEERGGCKARHAKRNNWQACETKKPLKNVFRAHAMLSMGLAPSTVENHIVRSTLWERFSELREKCLASRRQFSGHFGELSKIN